MKCLCYTFAFIFIMVLQIQLSETVADEDSKNRVAQIPSPTLEPSQVVSIQIEALRANGPNNEGIQITYRFASPGNKRSTGPLERFITMVQSSPYDRLLNHRSATYSPISITGDKALQEVTITDKFGEKVTFIWVLSRQNEGGLKDCWMTDAVITTQRLTPRRLV